MGDWQERSWAWHLIWRRNLYEWENDEVSRLKNHIEQIRPDRDKEDSVAWKHSGSLYSPTKSIGAIMIEDQTPILSKPIINLVWQKFINPRAQLSVWLANLEKLKTGDFLVEMGIIDAQLAVCPFCNIVTESNSNILFTCSFSWMSWMEMLKWWGISAVFHKQCRNFSIEWFGLVKSRKCRNLWGLVLGCVIWSLWYERNKIKFERRLPNLHKFDYSLKIKIGIWAKKMMGLTIVMA
ncbi:uncharacterized protein LOC130807239 [Amaranthus tricolor]|uniref:uncharacterized protein LOC130807239 n=1 Tax=Amaranthus tricolor TaxID=29722 RepID=UPI00258823B7|nr:uncharacterized protein LOC130807239 [Amaranthus tricolor]